MKKAAVSPAGPLPMTATLSSLRSGFGEAIFSSSPSAIIRLPMTAFSGQMATGSSKAARVHFDSHGWWQT